LEKAVNVSELPTLPLRRVENTMRQLLNDMRTVADLRAAHPRSSPSFREVLMALWSV
jgi:hypothetical protein